MSRRKLPPRLETPRYFTVSLPFAMHTLLCCFFFQAEDGIRDLIVTGVQTCALPIWPSGRRGPARRGCPPGGSRIAPSGRSTGPPWPRATLLFPPARRQARLPDVVEDRKSVV